MSTFAKILLYFAVAVITAIVVMAIKKRKKKEIITEVHPAPGEKPKDGDTDVDKDGIPADVWAAIKSGNKMEAVKRYKAYTKCSLAEAAAIIDTLAK